RSASSSPRAPASIRRPRSRSGRRWARRAAGRPSSCRRIRRRRTAPRASPSSAPGCSRCTKRPRPAGRPRATSSSRSRASDVMRALRHAVAASGVALLLSGCAAFRSYDAELYPALAQASSGNIDGAIRLLESNNRLPDKDLLYFMELGMLQRLGSRYDESQKAWTAAEARIEASRGGDAFAELASLASNASSFVLNDKMRVYQGHDYERVMLLTYMALNHLARGDYDNARIAIKQTHEFEAQVAELRAKQYAQVEEEARKRGARTSVRELNGYPVETIDNPAVNALRNSYQSALSHYLAGFVYEALGEPSLAAPGYRLANELQPDHPLLEEGLRGLDARVAAPDDGMTDVLFMIGSGNGPGLQSRQFPLPMWVQGRFIV